MGNEVLGQTWAQHCFVDILMGRLWLKWSRCDYVLESAVSAISESLLEVLHIESCFLLSSRPADDIWGSVLILES